MLPASPSESFETVLVRGADALGWTVAFVPFLPRELWPHMIRLRVAGELNGISFRSSLFPDANTGRYFLLVNKELKKRAGIALGARVSVTLWPDMDERPATCPDELAEALDEEPGLRAWYEELAPSMRREMRKWIEGVQGEESRGRRAIAMAERLLAAKEAEDSLPPLLKKSFARHPEAARGWPLLTPHQRRAELLAVFSYQSPEARARRVEKLCALAASRAKKA